jgi:hypothetical protein
MESILYKGIKFYLDGSVTQTSPLNKTFRYVGIRKDLTKPARWVNKVECWHWIYSFVYLENSGGFELHTNNSDTFLNVI